MQFSRKDVETVSNRINKIVEDSGMRKSDFAKMMGVMPCTLSTWMGGWQIPSLTNLIQIARYGGVTLDELLAGTLEGDKR